jgi:hypothetical protein
VNFAKPIAIEIEEAYGCVPQCLILKDRRDISQKFEAFQC